MDQQEVYKEQEQNGSITFANEVIATIAGIAAFDIPGVAGMSGGFKDGIADLLGKKNFTKGVKVQLKDNVVTIETQIILDYGVRAPEVCGKMQESIKKAVETMTGLVVNGVNITVQGVKFKELGEAFEGTSQKEE